MSQTRTARQTHATSGGIQVIARAASILRALEDEPTGLTLGQLAERLKLARSTVQRIVAALAAESLVIAASPTAGVKLGPALIRLASAANLNIDRTFRPAIAGLAQRLQETVDLSVAEKASAVFIDQVPGAHRLRAVSGIGEKFPLHCTANGKALLAVMPEAEWEKHLPRVLPAFTSRTITDIRALQREIARVRRDQVAYDNEEHTEGISALGIALLDPYGRPVAISIPVPTSRFARLEAKLLTEIAKVRRQLEEQLGQKKA